MNKIIYNGQEYANGESGETLINYAFFGNPDDWGPYVYDDANVSPVVADNGTSYELGENGSRSGTIIVQGLRMFHNKIPFIVEEIESMPESPKNKYCVKYIGETIVDSYQKDHYYYYDNESVEQNKWIDLGDSLILEDDTIYSIQNQIEKNKYCIYNQWTLENSKLEGPYGLNIRNEYVLLDERGRIYMKENKVEWKTAIRDYNNNSLDYGLQIKVNNNENWNWFGNWNENDLSDNTGGQRDKYFLSRDGYSIVDFAESSPAPSNGIGHYIGETSDTYINDHYYYFESDNCVGETLIQKIGNLFYPQFTRQRNFYNYSLGLSKSSPSSHLCNGQVNKPKYYGVYFYIDKMHQNSINGANYGYVTVYPYFIIYNDSNEYAKQCIQYNEESTGKIEDTTSIKIKKNNNEIEVQVLIYGIKWNVVASAWLRSNSNVGDLIFTIPFRNEDERNYAFNIQKKYTHIKAEGYPEEVPTNPPEHSN